MNKIILDLEQLEDELKKSKNPAADYIYSLLVIFKNKNVSQKKILNTLKIIKSGSKIIEFADFNYRQELIWLEIWKDATNLLEDLQ